MKIFKISFIGIFLFSSAVWSQQEDGFQGQEVEEVQDISEGAEGRFEEEVFTEEEFMEPPQNQERTEQFDEVDLDANSVSEEVGIPPRQSETEIFNQLQEINRFQQANYLNFEPYIYIERGRANPFEASIRIKRDAKKVSTKNYSEGDNILGLKAYDVVSYLVTSIMWNTQYPKAIVRDPAGESFIIEEGSEIGKSSGYVARIREGEVIVFEPMSQYKNDDMRYRTLVLKLYR